MTDDGLDQLSSEQLHDLAVSRAKHHADVKFFWSVIRTLPAAQAAAGNLQEAENDAFKLSAHVDDIAESGEGEVAEMMRPLYLEYLRKHGVTADKAR
jgi:hypothetical protein